MSGNPSKVREQSGKRPKVRERSGKGQGIRVVSEINCGSSTK